MTLLEQFARRCAVWGFKVERERIRGLYGYIEEFDGKLWIWTHSHAPGGHQFFPIDDDTELKAINLMHGFETDD
jgi:hypothetical protein